MICIDIVLFLYKKCYGKSPVDDLIDSPPNYYVGYYDCTSFVMDIADAAGVHYGNRLFIQTPMGFIQQMKQYNEIR